MNITALEAYGLDEAVLQVWMTTGHASLLPVQKQAIKQGKVLEGKNLVVFAPTSSGKTFVGETAAIKTARQNKRVVYLVPQKALAEEKYQDFKCKYAALGVRVIISTRERNEFDAELRAGRFHIAVVVFEKMLGLLVRAPHLLRNLGLVVVDELQMLSDAQRGAGLEILLTKIKTSAPKAQLIGLSAVLGSAALLAEWLNAVLVEAAERPVELRKGVLCDGKFEYIEHNSGKTSFEKFIVPEAYCNSLDYRVAQARILAEQGESCLVFCRSRQEAVAQAQSIAHDLQLGPAKRALEDLAHLEDSRSTQLLRKLLHCSMAYHNSDLDREQRDLVERWFRRGEIKVICATTTLAIGLNLPARNVFIDPERWDCDRHGLWSQVPISQSDYENISGRAGRMGLEREFGRAIIVTDSPFQARTYLETYARGKLGKVEPALAHGERSEHLLGLVASRQCHTADELRTLLLNSFSGQQYWTGGKRQEEFEQRLQKELQRCVAAKLISQDGQQLTATELGRLTAVKGLSVATAAQLMEFAVNNAAYATDLNLFELLLALTKTSQAAEVHLSLGRNEYRSGEYLALLKQAYRTLPEGSQKRLAAISQTKYLDYETARRIKKTLLLHRWVSGVSNHELEEEFACMLGTVSGMANEFCWLAESLGSIARISGWPTETIQKLFTLAEQLVFGVTPEGIELARLRLRGLGRTRIMKLVGAGYAKSEKILQAREAELVKLLGKPLVASLLKALKPEGAQNRHSPDQAHEPIEPATEEQWADSYPPADDAGNSYFANVPVVLDGQIQRKRNLVMIGGKKVWLRNQSFLTLLKLALQAQAKSLGWVEATTLGNGDDHHKIITRLRYDLKPAGLDVKRLIENSGNRDYRISVPPAQIKFDAAQLRERVDGAAVVLGETVKQRLAHKTTPK